jgi:putative ABC transport system ATP-binding protein
MAAGDFNVDLVVSGDDGNSFGVVEVLLGNGQGGFAIARALANEPSVLLADEPTAALDKERGRQVMELFRDVVREHAAGVIVVTHDERALDVFDTLYEMEDGSSSQGK